MSARAVSSACACCDPALTAPYMHKHRPVVRHPSLCACPCPCRIPHSHTPSTHGEQQKLSQQPPTLLDGNSRRTTQTKAYLKHAMKKQADLP